MRVKGTKTSVQSSIDFYLKLSSLGEMKTVQDLRNHYLNIFLNEERSQANLLLEEKRELEKRKAKELKELKELESRKNNLEEGIQVANTESISSNLGTSSEDFLNTEDTYDDTDIFSESFFSEEIKEEDRYVSHGIYLDEIDISSSEVEDEVETNEEEVESDIITPSQGYTEHGVFLEDLWEDEEEVDTSSSEFEDIFEEVEDEEIVDEDAEDVFEDTSEDLDSVFEDAEENESEESEDLENVFEDIEEDDLDSAFEDVIEEDEDSDDDFNNIFEDTISNAEEVETLPSLEVSKVEEPMEIPDDIRVFLRQHPNSEITYVAQFYSMKEINKQIKLGRIYKKRGKLLI